MAQSQTQIELSDLTGLDENKETKLGTTTDQVICVYSRGDPSEHDDTVRDLYHYAASVTGRDIPDERIDEWLNGDASLPGGTARGYDVGDRTVHLDHILTGSFDNQYDIVVAAQLGDFGGVRDAVDVVTTIVDTGTPVHLVDDELMLDPEHADTDTALDALRAAARIERRDAHRQVVPAVHGDDEPWRGQPPTGFETDDSGRLTPANDYDRVCAVLEQVTNGERSKRQASKAIGCSRRTVTRAIEERGDMYGLDD